MDEDEDDHIGAYRIESPEGEIYDVDAFYDAREKELLVCPYPPGKHELRAPEEWEAEQINEENRINWREVNIELGD